MPAFPGGRVSDAERAGIARWRLRTRAFNRLGRDLYVPADSVDSLLRHCQALHRVLPPDAAFCHGTAARLLGLPLPASFDQRTHIAVPAGAVVPKREQLVGHSLLLPPDQIGSVSGVRVSVAARTFIDLAPSLGLPALVALGDAALHEQLMTLADLFVALDQAHGRRGVVRARSARELLDARAESAPESMVRVWIKQADLPVATPQAVIRDASGGFVARVDLLIEEYRVVIEYEGAYHRGRDQYGRDLSRRNRIQALGYLVVHIDATTLSREAVLSQVTSALRQRGWVRTTAR